MGLETLQFCNYNPPFIDPIRDIRSHFDLWFQQIDTDPFDIMKSRCYPVTIEDAKLQGKVIGGIVEKSVYYSSIPFPHSMLDSPSFNDSPRFSNLIVNDNGILLKLIFSQVTPNVKNLPPSQQLILTTEYRNEKGLIARKFEGYIH